MVWNDAAYSAEVNVYGRKGLSVAPMLIPETDFAALARASDAEGAVVRTLDDLKRLRVWVNSDAAIRPFLLLDLGVLGSVVAPYQEEIARANTRADARPR